MMKSELFLGKLVRLDPLDPTRDSQIMAEWGRNSEYQRLQDSGPAWIATGKQFQDWMEKNLDEYYIFSIYSLSDELMIGTLDFSIDDWMTGNAWIGIGIGSSDHWGKGYGTEAMHIALDYAFNELGLRRISLTVFEYNPRAVRTYEKLGFKHEGRARGFLNRDGRRWDMIYMGLLRQEWENLKNTGN